MHLIEEPKKPESKKTPGLLERLFGKEDEFDKDENKTVIAHELTHALADQHYDLDAMQKAVKKDDDRSLALSALIEGEATLAMFGAGMDDWEGAEIVKLPAESLDWTFNLLVAVPAVHGRRQEPAQGPADHLRVDDLPLLQGHGLLREADQRRRLGGDRRGLSQPAAIDRADPPSREIPAPSPDLPMAIDLGALKPGAGLEGAGPQRPGRDADWPCCSASTAARRPPPAGTATVTPSSKGPKNRLGLVWLSTWDSEDDAREFTTAYVQYQTARFSDIPRPPREIHDTLWRNVGDQLYVVQRRGLDVAVIEGFPPEATVVAPRGRLPGQEDRDEARSAGAQATDKGKRPVSGRPDLPQIGQKGTD